MSFILSYCAKLSNLQYTKIQNEIDMNELFKKVKDIYEDGCVTIILKTHRTKPDSNQDAINLKNLIDDAEKRLYADFEKRFVWPIIENINKLVEDIDHSQNLEGLVLVANQTMADFTRIPIEVTSRVVVDKTFATRDLIRSMHTESSYYVLALSRTQARLIEAYNDKVVKEFKGEFPIEDHLYTTNKAKSSTNKGHDNLIEEFFNRVDKIVIETTKNNPKPIVLATEDRNFDYYLKVADQKDRIVGSINRDQKDESAHDLVKNAWEEVLELVKQKNTNRITELNEAVGRNHFVSDFNEIWSAIQEGKGKTLFVKRGFYQPALIDGNVITLVDDDRRMEKNVVDDIVDEMIEHNLAFGGDIVFVEGEELEGFQQLALTTRY